MLQVKSFKFKEGKEISEFLRNNRIAKNGDMIFSNGEILIPYDNGESASIVQQIIDAKMEMNDFITKERLINHSNKVLEIQVSNIDSQLGSLRDTLEEITNAANAKGNFAKKKEVENIIKVLENERHNTVMVIKQNEGELNRFSTNIGVYKETIKTLESFNK
jgi:hypothetical protein